MKELCARDFGYGWFNALASILPNVNPRTPKGGVKLTPEKRAPVGDRRKRPRRLRVNKRMMVGYGRTYVLLFGKRGILCGVFIANKTGKGDLKEKIRARFAGL